MAPQKQKVYKSPSSKKYLTSVIQSGCRTPILKVKFCSLVKPYYYPNSPNLPRYSVTCQLDGSNPEHQSFMRILEAIEKNEGVETIIKNDTRKKMVKYSTQEILLSNFRAEIQFQ